MLYRDISTTVYVIISCEVINSVEVAHLSIYISAAIFKFIDEFRRHKVLKTTYSSVFFPSYICIYLLGYGPCCTFTIFVMVMNIPFRIRVGIGFPNSPLCRGPASLLKGSERRAKGPSPVMVTFPYQ
jgi:hypothetical protein